MSRVLALVTDAYGGRGGIAQAARDVIGAIASIQNVDVVDVLPRHAPELSGDVPRKVRQAPASAGRLGYALRGFLKAWSDRPNIVFCNHLYMAPLAALVARFVGAKLIVQLHGIEIWPEPTLACRAALEVTDLLLCVSRHTRARALTHCDLMPERALVLNNTVDPRFTPGDRDASRAKFDLEGEFALLIVGRLDTRERYKGHNRVITALPELSHPQGRKVVFLVAGEGDDRHRLAAEAEAVGVKDRVRFLGQVSDANLLDLYRAADLFVMPSTGEGFGIAFLEAMACGTPALGIASGGAPDALCDGELGRAARECSFERALAEAISEPVHDPIDLNAQVVTRFGRIVFERRLRTVLQHLLIRNEGG